MCVGLLVRLAPGNVVQDMISFKSTILLNVLLPPIILNSGYQLKQVSWRSARRRGRGEAMAGDEEASIHRERGLTSFALPQENFFRNFGVILTFAFAGTFISAVVLGCGLSLFHP
jgi:solute carrier family 9 (sodium/hydrogen exchanger), member 6/7